MQDWMSTGSERGIGLHFMGSIRWPQLQHNVTLPLKNRIAHKIATINLLL